MTPQMQLQAFLAHAFPHAALEIVQVGDQQAVLRQPVRVHDLRPGGTVSGPTLMGLADAALYVAILGEIGLVELAVTSSLTINFLRKPMADRALRAECRLLRLGRTLAVGEVSVYSEGEPEPVAHVVGTYAIPARPGAV